MAKVLFLLHRVALLVTLTVALAATGMAHRLPTAQDQALAFALANGASLADFCGDVPGGDAHPAPDCVACQITAGADLPPGGGGFDLLPRVLIAGLTAPRPSPVLVPTVDPAHRPQGPPAA